MQRKCATQWLSSSLVAMVDAMVDAIVGSMVDAMVEELSEVLRTYKEVQQSVAVRTCIASRVMAHTIRSMVCVWYDRSDCFIQQYFV